MKYTGKVLKNTEIAEKIWRMVISTGKQFKSRPGQFINVLVNDTFEPLLRKPFSIFESTDKTVTIVYKVVGAGTAALTEKKPGDKLDFVGPLGNSYLDFLPKKAAVMPDIILIGGGTGAASTYCLAKYLKAKKIKFGFIQGARCKTQMVAVPEFKKMDCVFATDDGSLGQKGFVSDILEKKLKNNSIIFTCGPKPMFKAIKAVAGTKSNVAIFASFEEYMGCGIGACVSCVVEIKTGGTNEYKRVCKDGTIFDLNDIIF
jgi:dihydroorotate dehydrogenase electron transfer subunit